MARTRKLTGGSGSARYRLSWKGEEVLMRCTYGAGVVMAAQMFAAETDAKNSLVPGQGVDTGTMQRRTHVAPPGYDWPSDNVEATPNTSALGGKIVLPDMRDGRLALELGCGQDYTIYFHQDVYPYLRLAHEKAMANFKKKVEEIWQQTFRFK